MKNIYMHTKDGLARRIYAEQKKSSKKRGHKMPAYTSNDLYEWLFSQKNFHHLYHLWEISNFDRMARPSVDRLDDYMPYAFSNIQLMTWQENFDKGHNDRKDGINNKQNKAVLQYSMDGEYLQEYYSTNNAGRCTLIKGQHIARAARGERRQAGGFVWEYKGDGNEE